VKENKTKQDKIKQNNIK